MLACSLYLRDVVVLVRCSMNGSSTDAKPRQQQLQVHRHFSSSRYCSGIDWGILYFAAPLIKRKTFGTFIELLDRCLQCPRNRTQNPAEKLDKQLNSTFYFFDAVRHRRMLAIFYEVRSIDLRKNRNQYNSREWNYTFSTDSKITLSSSLG